MQIVVRAGLALVCVAVYGAATAQRSGAAAPEQPKTNPHFLRLDANKDGFLSYQEARADKQTARHFARFDENRDGRLSEDEFLKLKAAQARHRDGNYISDGVITSKVRLALMRAKDLKSTDIHVETIAGTVRLAGEVDDAKQAARVEQLAGRVKGVKKVDSRLSVRSTRK
jgi:hypothetical protein